MNSPFPFLLVILVLVISGCKDDPGTVNLNFLATFNGNPLDSDTATTHEYNGDSTLRFSKLRFYVSDVRLFRAGNSEEAQLIEIESIDLSKSNTSTVSFDNIPSAKYGSLEFYLGVNKTLNGTKPADYQSDHPLAGNYWSAWDSYIHCQLEGFLNPNDGTDEIAFTYHTGSDDLLRDVSLPYNFDLGSGANQSLDVQIDVKKLLSRNNVFWDIARYPVTHNPSNPEHLTTAQYISDNFQTAFSVE